MPSCPPEDRRLQIAVVSPCSYPWNGSARRYHVRLDHGIRWRTSAYEEKSLDGLADRHA